MHVNAHWTKFLIMVFRPPWRELVSFFFSAWQDACLCTVFRQARFPPPLAASQMCFCKILKTGPLHIHISKLLTSEMSESSINFDTGIVNPELKILSFIYPHVVSVWPSVFWGQKKKLCLWNNMSISKWQFRWTI